MKWLSTVTVDADGIRIGSQTWEWPAVDVVSNADFLVVGRLTLRLVDGTRVSAWGSTSAAKDLAHSAEEELALWATASRERLLEANTNLQAFLDGDRYLSQQVVSRFQAENPALPDIRAHRSSPGAAWRR